MNLQYVEGAKSFKGTKAYTKKEALDHYRAAAGTTSKPFIYLSAGVSNPEFIEDLEFAAEAGVKFNGVLCGRATWKDGIPIFAEKGGRRSARGWKTEGVEEHRQREQRAEGRHPVVQHLRSAGSRGYAVRALAQCRSGRRARVWPYCSASSV